MNLIRGRRRPDLEQDGRIVLETPGGAIVHGAGPGRGVGGDALFSVLTVHLRLARERPATSVNVWPATVRQRVFQGDFTQYHLDWDGRPLVVRQVTADPVSEGETVYLVVEPRHCVLLED